VAARFVWHGMAGDLAAWCRDCQGCARGKVVRHTRAALVPIPVPSRRFSHVHLDIVGPLPSSRGKTHILTIIDRTTRWVEAAQLENVSTREVLTAFTEQWISRFGCPDTVTTDRGSQFTSAEWQEFCRNIGASHVATTAYHPQANGLVERLHRQLKDALRSRGSGTDWSAQLPWILLGLRAAPKDDSGMSSAECVFGSPLTLPGEFLGSPDLPSEDFVRRVQEGSAVTALAVRPRSYAQVTASVPAELLTAEHVYVRRDGHKTPLSPLYEGPFAVVKSGEKFFVIKMGGKEATVSIDRLKPHQGGGPVVPADPTRRGRPPLARTASSPAT
jgi:hypothetical protein